MNEAQKFEQQVERIFSVIENSGTVVSWDASIPDIEVPNITRQIDVLLERDGKKVIVECRNHKRPQDIQWVEHLDSKKLSVGADAVIGVSSSGFTSSALKKAEARGVFLRHLEKISEDELSSWTNFNSVEVCYINFRNIEIDITIKINTKNYAYYSDKAKSSKTIQMHAMSLLNQIIQEKGDEILDNGAQGGTYRLNNTNFKIGRAKVNSMAVRTDAHPYKQVVEGLTLSRFIDANTEQKTQDAIIHKIGEGGSELICGDRRTLWTTDLSSVDIPTNCVFHDYRILGVYIDGKFAVKIIGSEKFNPFSNIEAHINLHFGDNKNT